MQIGAQGYTIREHAQDEAQIRQSLKKLHDIGYRNLQVSAFGQLDSQILHEICLENQILVTVTHTNPELILNNTEQVISDHKILECKNVGIGCIPVKYQTGLDGVREFLKDFDAPARKLHAAGMKLQYHNHSYEYQKADDKRVFLDVMAEETDPELWGFILDVFWTQAGGRCPAQQLKQLKGRIDICHFKDMAIVGREQRTAAVMDGNLSWDEIFAACKETGIEYAMVEQDETYGKDPFDELKLSFDNLVKAGI